MSYYSSLAGQLIGYSGSSNNNGQNYGVALNSAIMPYAGQGHTADNKMYAHSLETVVQEEPAELRVKTRNSYVPSSAGKTYLTSATPHNYFVADTFLVPGTTARFVGSAEEIRQYVEEAFRQTTGKELPDNIQISVLDDAEFQKAHIAHNGNWNEGVQGFSLNANGRGTSQVFVRANPLDKLLLTTGHEIGHVLTPTLKDARDEEAKAFAFSMAWMNTIKENNIASIGNNILPQPAQNGLHDKAFDFVQSIVTAGTSAWETFLQIAKGALTITQQPEIVEVS